MSKFSQKGVSLFLAIIILAMILAIVLGLTTILVSQIKMIRGIEYSVTALYAADTGIEKVLKIYYENEANLQPSYFESLANGASYQISVVCCSSSLNSCDFWSGAAEPESCPFGSGGEKINCEATRYCVRSVGIFEETQRAIEVKLFPRATP